MPDELSVSHTCVNASLTVSLSLLGRGQGRVRLQGWSFQLRGTKPTLNKPSLTHIIIHRPLTASTATQDLCAVTLYAVDTPSISVAKRMTTSVVWRNTVPEGVRRLSLEGTIDRITTT
jgi:hypothetical protein